MDYTTTQILPAAVRPCALATSELAAFITGEALITVRKDGDLDIGAVLAHWDAGPARRRASRRSRLETLLRGSRHRMRVNRYLMSAASSDNADQGAHPVPRLVAGLTGVATAQPSDEHCATCMSPDEHDEWNADARGETPLQRADRAYGEILQEVRVAQTGVQILFAFLLTLAFTSRFATITAFQKHIYVLTLMLSAAATALLIAPAAFHRMVYRRRLKQHLVRAANRLALAGLVLLLLAMVSALLLILDVVTGLGLALVLAAGALSWFITWWFILPTWKRLRHQGHQRHRGRLMIAPGPRRRRES